MAWRVATYKTAKTSRSEAKVNPQIWLKKKMHISVSHEILYKELIVVQVLFRTIINFFQADLYSVILKKKRCLMLK